MARKPREKSEIAKPTILRSVRLANGDVYGPGEEEELLEALEAAAAQAEDEAEGRREAGLKPDTFDPKKEIKRLSKLGFLVNFKGADEDDDDEEEDLTHEHKVRRAIRREAQGDQGRPVVAAVEEEETPKAERLRGRNKARIEEEESGRSAKAPTRKGSKAKDGEAPEKVEAPDDGVDPDADE